MCKIVVSEIRSKDRKRFGVSYPGEVAKGEHASIVPGKSVTLFGTKGQRTRYVKGLDGKLVPNEYELYYWKKFEIGGTAVYGSYNLTYTGKIVAITEKTVTIDEENGTRHRLSLHEFSWRNWNFDLDEIAKRNSEWRD